MNFLTTNPFDSDHLQRMRVFGIYGTSEASINTALGLHALQHRGQEATGIVSFDGKEFHAHRGIGHVGENFGAGSARIESLTGHVALAITAIQRVANQMHFLKSNPSHQN